MNYPLLSEYCSAVKEAADNFYELQHLRPVLDAHGEPVMSCGNFAVVFKMHDAHAGKDVAVKCFLKEQEGRAASYRLISQELSFVSSNFLTPIRYLDKELFVASNTTEDEEFPVVLMDWIEGETLDRYVVSNLGNTYAMQKLAFQFSRLASWLMSQPFAHGDLQPDNILVRTDGSLVLVDYDGMFVPAMQGQKARELGSPDFCHPQRTADCFNEHIDDFALTVILLSIKALSIRPSLWNDYAAADRLLFSAADYRDLIACDLLKNLPELFTDAELIRIYGLFLLAYAGGDLSAVSFRLLNLSFPENTMAMEDVANQREKLEPLVGVVMELSTKLTDEDKAEGILDEFGVLYSKDGSRLLEGNDKLKEYTVREGTRVICNNAFSWCSDLFSLTLPFGLKSIGESAFSHCGSLSSLILPASLTSIGDDAFSGCKSLSCLLLPADLKSIGESAFSHCGSLSSLTLPAGLTSIGDLAFSGCRSLTSLVLPASLKSIGDFAFENCESLSSLTLPTGLTSIGESAFEGCESLSSLTLPAGLTSIGAAAFSDCNKLSIYNNSSHFLMRDDMLFSSDGKKLLCYFGKECSANVPASVQHFSDCAFSGCESLTSLALPAGLTSIGDFAFSGCRSLTSLVLPASLTSIGDFAFLCCDSLTSLVLPASLTSIGSQALDYCESLTFLYIPKGSKEHFKKLLPSEYHSKLRIQSNS